MGMDKDTTFSSKSKHFDMMLAINAKIQWSPIQWHWLHVKGHPDDYFGLLDRRETLNLECDHAEKKRWAPGQEKNSDLYHSHNLEDELWILYSNVLINTLVKQETNLGRNNFSQKCPQILKFSYTTPSVGPMKQDRNNR